VQQPDRHVIIVGGGFEENEIKELISKINKSKTIIYTGRVPHKDILKYYSIIDILVYPRIPTRLYNIVTPLKPLEAMAMGKAVLASDVGGLKELINNGVSGLLFKAGDAHDLVEKCSYLIKEKGVRMKLGQRGRMDMKEKRNWEGIVSKYKDIYERLLLNNEN